MKRTPRRRREDGAFSDGTVKWIWDRDGGRCAWCGTPIVGERGWVWQVHHRLPRAVGGTSAPHVGRPSNGVLLHTTCHLDVESYRVEAVRRGFIIRHGVELPRMVPIDHKVLGWVRLRDDGTYDKEEWR